MVERIGFGCVGLSVLPSVRTGLKLLECAYSEGIQWYDTAPLYGAGYSEMVLGKFIQGKREKVKITTKFGLGNLPSTPLPAQLAIPLNYWRRNFSKKKLVAPHFNFHKTNYRLIDLASVKASLEGSLRRLKTDYIDHYLIHEGLPTFLSEDALTYLLEQKKSGVIKCLGIGACFKNFEDLQENELKEWDILQYEFGPKIPSQYIPAQFPGKLQVGHSISKSLDAIQVPTITSPSQRLPYLLAKLLHEHPKSVFLFSSSKEQHIRDNIRSASSFYNSFQ